MTEMTDREVLQELAAQPIGNRDLQRDKNGYINDLAYCFQPEAVEAARRASKKWLPSGKRPFVTPEDKAREAELRACQTDIEDAVEAAGGQRGTAKAA